MTKPEHALTGASLGLDLLAAPPPAADAARGLAWMVTFADLAALLLSFFVMLFAMTGIPGDMWRSTVQSLTLSFKVATELDADVPTAHRNSRLTRLPPIADLGYLGTILEANVADDPDLAGVRIIREPETLRLVFAQHPVFANGGVELVPGADRTLAAISNRLRNIGNPLSVAVHGDADGTADGLYASGWELSVARAVVVAGALARAGDDRPIVAVGRVDAGGGATANSVDIAILPDTGGRR
ncbi:MAG: hypothetical protein IPM60_11805 [Rhodospirillales bacterium]|nr:hypothetical protein [Rhodospirillales bacterium]